MDRAMGRTGSGDGADWIGRLGGMESGIQRSTLTQAGRARMALDIYKIEKQMEGNTEQNGLLNDV